MSGDERRTVGQRGQVTIPKAFRERFGIHGGDDVMIRADGDRLVIEPPVTREELAEGYRRRAERDRELVEEMANVSLEADAHLGDAPDW